MAQPTWHPEQLAARLPFLRRRALLTQAVRAFFLSRGYTEVETPYAVPSPGEDVHLSAFRTEQITPDGTRRPLWLHTSPEFAMKRLLVAGAGPIFQLARVWRNGEGSPRHAAEFTMLEWYRPGATMDDLMAECAALLRAVLPPLVTSGGITTRLDQMEFIRMADAFREWVGADLLATADDATALAASAGVALRDDESWEDLFFRLLLGSIEPLKRRWRGAIRQTFVWPSGSSSMSAGWSWRTRSSN
jgi:lysyl-tRNA synthetase class 2